MLQLRKAERSNFNHPLEQLKAFDDNYFIHPKGLVISTKKRTKTILKPGRSKCGYYTVSLNRKSFSVHRLVAEHFIPNPQNKPCVNHKDGDKSNNHVANLEWVTYSENMCHAVNKGLQTPPSGKTLPHAKKVINTKTGQIYFSIAEAARAINKSYSHVLLMLNGKRKNTTNLKFVN